MSLWAYSIVFAIALIAGGAVYIQLRWQRSPQAYRAMIVLGGCYFVAGSVLGSLVFHPSAPRAPIGTAVNGPITELERAEGLKALCAADTVDPNRDPARHNMGLDGKIRQLNDLIPAATAVLSNDPNISHDRINIIVNGTMADLHSGVLMFNCGGSSVK